MHNGPARGSSKLQAYVKNALQARVRKRRATVEVTIRTNPTRQCRRAGMPRISATFAGQRPAEGVRNETFDPSSPDTNHLDATTIQCRASAQES